MGNGKSRLCEILTSLRDLVAFGRSALQPCRQGAYLTDDSY